MAFLYADENFPLPTVETLRQLGHVDAALAAAGDPSGQLIGIVRPPA